MLHTMTATTFGFRDLGTHGAELTQFLRLRKRFFVDTLCWSIPHDDDMEMDQYDNPTAHYSVALRDGRVVGGARIMRYDAQWGANGCMMADAARGTLPDIPASAVPASGLYAHASECTRLVLCDSLRAAPEREAALSIVVDGLVRLAQGLGTPELVTLTVPAFARSLRKMGYDASQIGDRWRSAQDGRSYAVLHMPAARNDACRSMRMKA